MLVLPLLFFYTSTHEKTGSVAVLQETYNKHERSGTHIQNQIALKTFGTSRIDLALDEQRRLKVSIHNAKVKENREILKDLIIVLARKQVALQ